MRWLDSINDSVDMDLSKSEKIVEDRGSWCQLKTMYKFQVNFYLGQNEGCILGGSISDSSERLLQSDNRGRSIFKVFVNGEFNTVEHSFYKRFFVSHEALMSP